MNRHCIHFLAVLVLLALPGCGDFDPGSLITKTRALGARIEVEQEPEIASPRPGERAHVTWITVSPKGEPLLRWAFVACVMEGEDNSACTQPFATFEGSGRVPALDLEVPNEKQLGPADGIKLLGMICERGTPAHDTSLRCEGEHAVTMAVELEVALARTEQRNTNPNLNDARLSLEGRGLPADTSEVTPGGCEADPALPRVKADGKEHDLGLDLGAHLRERYQDQDGRPNVLEELQISQFVTAGELERQYSFVESTDATEAPRITQTWTAPERDEVSEPGEVVRFVTVVRDLRGGLAVLERSLCVVR